LWNIVAKLIVHQLYPAPGGGPEQAIDRASFFIP
jgi:hypothetical protein